MKATVAHFSTPVAWSLLLFLYRNRPLVVKAIEQRDYKIMGLRRADQWGHGY